MQALRHLQVHREPRQGGNGPDRVQVRLWLSRLSEPNHEHHLRPHAHFPHADHDGPRTARPGDQVCALYDEDEKKLRLYCIRLGAQILILGGGGHKPSDTRALQETPKLEIENEFVRKISVLLIFFDIL